MASRHGPVIATLTLLLAVSPGLAVESPAAGDGSWVQDAPQLGRAVDDSALAVLGSTVFPDGHGLPAGSGSALQGEAVYERHCLACHGRGGRGGSNDALVGGQGTLATATPKKTVGSYWPYATTLFDYIGRAMPYHAAGTLSADELYAVTAYLLHANGIIEHEQVLDARTLPAVVMPNRDSFDWLEAVD